jgi:hypothetical protein
MAKVTLTAFIQAAHLKASKDSQPVKAVIEAIVLGLFESSVVNGRTVIRTSEAAGSVEFSLGDGLSPSELVELATTALRWIESRPDPLNPGIPRQVKRLRVCFDRGSL